jgi:hypothetical protein
MSTPARGRAAYRSLLRAVERHITAVGGNAAWREAVQAHFRAAQAERDASVVAAGVRRAEDLAYLVNSVNDHKARWRVGVVAEHLPRVACRARLSDSSDWVHGCAQNLLISYGISLDKEADTRDRVKHTAARVGLLVRDSDYGFEKGKA